MAKREIRRLGDSGFWLNQEADVFSLFTFSDESLPTFGGRTHEDHIDAWHAVRHSTRVFHWLAAAIAASYARHAGARTDLHGAPTDIQRFCREVGITKSQFSQLSRTYEVFSQPVCTGANTLAGNGPLEFKHLLVAANYSDDPVAAVEAARDEGWSANELYRRLRKERHQKQIKTEADRAVAGGRYQVCVADPPWQYDNAGFEQSADAKYPTMPVDEIMALPECDRTFPKRTKNGVLFLWVTAPMMSEGLTVLHGWGYDYQNQMIWRKPRAPGMGWWLFTEHEVVLIGERGSFRPVERVPSVFDAPVRAHSQKPDEFYALVERMYPGTRRVELFARTKRPGWGDVWGNQV